MRASDWASTADTAFLCELYGNFGKLRYIFFLYNSFQVEKTVGRMVQIPSSRERPMLQDWYNTMVALGVKKIKKPTALTCDSSSKFV